MEDDRQRRGAAFHSLTPDSSFEEWWKFAKPGCEFHQAAIQGASEAKSRQEQVPTMLVPGRRELFLALPKLNLIASPEIEQAVRGFLMDQASNLMPYKPDGPATTQIVTEWLDALFPTIRWLIDNHRSCHVELTAISKEVTKYPDSPERQNFLAKLNEFATREEVS